MHCVFIFICNGMILELVPRGGRSELVTLFAII